jgi:hypothetical protein
LLCMNIRVRSWAILAAVVGIAQEKWVLEI